ncbi:hypothetical protein [Pseudoxanthomonas kaohsiungensis]|uniref:Uncharacterized protein n=1 Tax=Pseudoxanthomonas kaohsiungensis TaxID=283923 RepID=A0ABW3LX86_9GAMM|nr:hypothetical protein [Pseudoxanthomonas kaohsiungensis]
MSIPRANSQEKATNSNASRAVLVPIFVSAGGLAACASTPRDANTFGRGVSGEVQSVE